MPTTATPRRHALPPLRPQEEYAGRQQPAGPLRRWLTRFVGCEAGTLLPGRTGTPRTGKDRMAVDRTDTGAV